MSPIEPFTVVVGAANVGAFVVEAIGLGHLVKDSPKNPIVINAEARTELRKALDILLQFHKAMDDDTLSPLIERYNE
jgi:hypothetical protein